MMLLVVIVVYLLLTFTFLGNWCGLLVGDWAPVLCLIVALIVSVIAGWLRSLWSLY